MRIPGFIKHCFPLLLLLFSACAGARDPDASGKPLYIFQKDGIYGICDAGKRIVVEPSFSDIRQAAPYFLARRSRSVMVLLDDRGNALDSGSSIGDLTDSALIVFNAQDPRSRYGTGGVAPHPQQVFFKDGRRMDLPGHVMQILPDYDRRLNRLLVDSGGMQALLQLAPLKVLIPFRHRILDRSQGAFIRAFGTDGSISWYDIDGNRFPSPPGLPRARPLSGSKLWVVDSSTPRGRSYHDYAAFYDATGRLLRTHTGNYAALMNLPEKLRSGFSERYFILTNGAPSDEGTTFSIMDSTGALILDQIHRISPVYGNLIVTAHRQPKEPNHYQGYQDDGIFDLVKQRYILRADAATSIYKGDQIVFADQGGYRTVYDGNGDIAARFPIRERTAFEGTYQRLERETGRSFRGRLFSAGMHDVLYTRSSWAYRAFRSDSAAPFVVYSQNMMTQYPLLLDDFQELGQWEFAGRVHGRWGLWTAAPRREGRDDIDRMNGTIVEKIPPRYDSIVRYRGLYKVSSGGRTQWLDTGGKLQAGGRSFRLLEGPPVEGNLLSYENQNDVSAPVSVVNGAGAVIAVLPPPERTMLNLGHNFAYRLIPGGKVLRFTPQGEFIYTLKTGKSEKLEPKFWEVQLMSSLRGPLAAFFKEPGNPERSGEARGEGVYALAGNRVLIPPGRYQSFESQPYGETAIAIYGRDGWSQRLLLGILEGNGDFYSGADVH